MSKRPDCLTCGLCCCAPSGQDAFCDVTEEDVKKLDKKFKLKVWRPSTFDLLASALDGGEAPFGALKTKQVGDFTVCVALAGKVGKKVKCTTYATRPKTCHEAVVPGDHTCRTLRYAYREDLTT